MELSWADIVQQFSHEEGRAWADDDDSDEPRTAAGRINVDETWADIVEDDEETRTYAAVVGRDDEAFVQDYAVDEAFVQDYAVPGDPVGIRAIQSILMSATQMSLSHFHTAGMDTVATNQPSAAEAMNSIYTNTGMTFQSTDDVYAIRKQIVGARLSSFVTTVGGNFTVLPDHENVWYEVLGRPMYEGNVLRIYIDYNKMRNHGLTLSDLACQTFGNDIAYNVSPDFMGMIDVEVPNAHLSQWLSRMNNQVCGTRKIRSCNKVENRVTTRGTDVLAVSRVHGVNKRTVTSNDVSEVEKYFGVEAAAAVLSELTGSHVVSDFMTRTGQVLSFLKNSAEVRSKGLLTSMGFERPKEDIKKMISGASNVAKRQCL